MLPVIFSVGPVTIYSLSFLVAIGFFLAAFIVWRRLKDLGLDEERVIDFIILASLFGFFCSKLFSFVEKKTFSGFAFGGGLVGVSLTAVLFSKKNRWDLWRITDETIFGVMPLAVLAKIGTFLDGSAPGRPTSMPWGVYFPGSFLRTQPVSIFSALAFFFIWVLLLRIEREWRIWEWHKSKGDGFLTLVFLMLAFLSNFVVAFWRSSGLYWYWTEVSLSFLGTLGSLLLLYIRSGRKLDEDLVLIFRRKSNGKEKGRKKKSSQD